MAARHSVAARDRNACVTNEARIFDAIVSRSHTEMHTFVQAAKETCGTGEVGDGKLAMRSTWGGKSEGGPFHVGGLLLMAESPSVFGYFSKLVTGSAGSRTRGGASVDAKPGARVVSKASIDRRFCSGKRYGR